MVRLVGLSGVGKTRLVQALFDARIGLSPLPPSLAVYTNLSDNPDPQPTGLASDLIANRTRAVLIVDNCPPDLHRRLSDLCAASGRTVSVLTVEYDVRDDQPEGTQVVTLDTSSPELIEKLIRRRFPHVSEVDARTIAEASGGNARIAVALAGTVEQSETIAGLSDDELFQRLFRQRHDPNDALLLAAQACSLVYSSQGEALAGDEAELPRLAVLADQAPRELYRHVGELLRRDLVQQRSVWRAVLPHAIANRLAARALEDTPYDLIEQQLVTGGTDRLARSFSRRLAFLHEHPRAIAIVERWLAAGGLLVDATALNDLGRAMFENIAPVSPGAALAALERASGGDPEMAVIVLRQHHSLLRSLAYDPPLFERSASLLALAATQGSDEREAKEASDTFVSLFTIYLSGTHATIEQRLGLTERLLRSSDPKERSLGLAALDEVLEATHFSSGHRFEFGARSRDYGYRPRSDEDVSRWADIRDLSGEALSAAYARLLETLSRQGGIILKAQSEIQDPAKLKRLVGLIDGETWLGLPVDVKGAIYEGLLARNAEDVKSGAGQYFTPRPVIEAMVAVVDPQPHETVHDPACGTAGFLLSAWEHMKAHPRARDRAVYSALRGKFSGVDIVPEVVRLAAMNLYLHGITGADSIVEAKDALLGAGSKSYDVVLANPPFDKKQSYRIVGADGEIDSEREDYDRSDFFVTTSNKQLNFLQHIMTVLGPSGRADVVLPDNVLFEGGAGETIRRRLLRNFDFHTLLRLPTGIFYKQGVKANVLFFDKKPPSETAATSALWVYDLRTNKRFTLKERPMVKADLDDFVTRYRSGRPRLEREERERFRRYTLADLLARDKVNLDLFWLKDDALDDPDLLPPPDEVAAEIMESLQTALEGFRAVAAALSAR